MNLKDLSQRCSLGIRWGNYMLLHSNKTAASLSDSVMGTAALFSHSSAVSYSNVDFVIVYPVPSLPHRPTYSYLLDIIALTSVWTTHLSIQLLLNPHSASVWVAPDDTLPTQNQQRRGGGGGGMWQSVPCEVFEFSLTPTQTLAFLLWGMEMYVTASK